MTKVQRSDMGLNLVGKRTAQGHKEVSEIVDSALEPNLTALRIDHALTHGKVGAVNGSLTTEDGSQRGFCVMLTFATTKAERVRQIKLYLP